LLDHIGLGVRDYARSKAFYAAALMPLDIELVMEFEGWAGFGPAGTSPQGLQRTPSFWIHEAAGPLSPAHVAFRSADRARVRAFWDAALAAGGRDNGAPGVRAHYHPTYYGAFVLDPDGHNIEAVCHAAE
jgi:catechol 2,3-dioxygenase-like lactoylglutathione lyase family enzyme